MLSGEGNETGAPYNGFLKYIENTYLAIHKVLLALQKCILGGAIKFVSQRSAILGKHESFRNYKVFRIISQKFQMQFNVYPASRVSFDLSGKIEGDSARGVFKVLRRRCFFRFLLSSHFLIRKFQDSFLSMKNSLTRGMKCEKSNFRKSQGIYQNDQMNFKNCT